MKKQAVENSKQVMPPSFKTPVKLENPLNQDIWYCNDINEVHFVDSVEYIRVFKKGTPNRTNLMRKTALRRVT